MRFRAGYVPIAGGILGILAIAMAPAPVHAQESPPPAPTSEITDEKLTVFATAFLKISDVRDGANDELGRVHDAQGKAAIRTRLEQRIGKVLEEQGLTVKEYQGLVYGVSADPALRERFDRILETLKPKPAGG